VQEFLVVVCVGMKGTYLNTTYQLLIGAPLLSSEGEARLRALYVDSYI
jgi:hypothetical protein